MHIAEWQWDDGNVAHMAEHGVRPLDVEDVWYGRPRFRRNKHGRAASHQMIGPNTGGTCYAVFIVRVEDGLWRVVTARRATDPEIDWWRSCT